jgi:hypothetical protein
MPCNVFINSRNRNIYSRQIEVPNFLLKRGWTDKILRAFGHDYVLLAICLFMHDTIGLDLGNIVLNAW